MSAATAVWSIVVTTPPPANGTAGRSTHRRIIFHIDRAPDLLSDPSRAHGGRLGMQFSETKSGEADCKTLGGRRSLLWHQSHRCGTTPSRAHVLQRQFNTSPLVLYDQLRSCGR
jgi:hypothetical protein